MAAATAGLPPQQELKALQAAAAEFAREKEKLTAQLAGYKAETSQKKEAIAELERTVAELQKPDGQREGLVYSAAEFQKRAAQQRAPGDGDAQEAKAKKGVKQDAVAAFAAMAQGNRPAKEDIDLQCRLATAISRGSTAELNLEWESVDFDREFSNDGGPMDQFYKKLSPEQRLFWEIQNPIEHSLRVDRKLLSELRKAGKKSEIELLLAAAGTPTEREKQYRALLWLRHHADLEVSYAEPTVGHTSLLNMACQSGYSDVARVLLERRADVNHAGRAGGPTALTAAVQRGNWDCARILLESGANAQAPAPSGGGGGASDSATPLLVWAAGRLQPEDGRAPSCGPAVPLLLEFRACPDALDSQGRSALMLAVAHGDKQACEALIGARADPNIKDHQGKTVFEIATERGHFALFDWLDSRP